MSEFKFICPVCGQHIATDSAASGTQIECPTCFQKIIVPDAPKSDSKYILSATQYIKPHVPPPTSALPGRSIASSKGLGPAIFAFLALICTVLVGIHLLRGRNAPADSPETPTTTIGSSGTARVTPAWSLNLANTEIPDAAAAGKVHDKVFFCQRAVLENGSLVLRQGRQSDVTVTIHLFATDSHALGGRTFNVGTNDAVASPGIVLGWKEADLSMTQKFTNGYAMQLEFGPVTAGNVPGRIFLCVPDKEESLVAGTFNAEINNPVSSPKRQ
ncbi:MAG: hypothetical protein ABSA69_02050 [Verrucomicrobiota bacterium]|jgi:DNA-directed RNA polymerase subunit RPC12/RpoP